MKKKKGGDYYDLIYYSAGYGYRIGDRRSAVRYGDRRFIYRHLWRRHNLCGNNNGNRIDRQKNSEKNSRKKGLRFLTDSSFFSS